MNLCANLWHEATNGRHSLSHALSGVPAPSKREPGWLSPFTRLLAEIRGFGRFSSPLRNSVIFYRLRSSGDTPSVTPCRACQLPQGGSRDGFHHSSDRPETGRLRAIFIAPTKGLHHSSAIFIAPTKALKFLFPSVYHTGKGLSNSKKEPLGGSLGGYSSMRLMSAPRAVSFPIKFS